MSLTVSIITRGRPAILAETIRGYLGGISRDDTVIHVAIDDDDEATVNAKLPVDPQVIYSIQPREDTRGLKHQRVLTDAPADIYLVGTDHTPILSPGWDQVFLDAMALFPDGIGVVSTKLANASFPFVQGVTQKWVDLTGCVQPTQFPFWFIDDWTDAVAKMTGRYVMVDVDVNSNTHPQKTIGMHDVAFWAAYYNALEGERVEQANRIIDALDEPEWRKAVLRSNFSRILVWDRRLNDGVMVNGEQYQASRSAETTPPWAGYVRAKERATKQMLRMLGMPTRTGASGKSWPQEEGEPEAFAALLKERGVKRYLEIGCRYGDTLDFVMNALGPDATCVAVDLPGGDGFEKVGAEILKAVVEKHNGTLILGDSHDPEIIAKVAALGPFDAVLIDGDHTYEGAKADFEAYGPMAGIVAFHDIVCESVGVPKLWEELGGRNVDPMYSIVSEGSMMGFGVILKTISARAAA